MPPDKRLEKLKNILNELNDGLTRDEFVSAFKAVTDYVKGIKSVTENDLQAIKEAVDKAISRIESTSTSKLSDVKTELQKSVDDTMSKMMLEHESMMAECDAKMGEMEDGEDGEDADEERVIEEVLKRIPPVKVESETGETIVDKINALPTDEDSLKIAIEHIKGLEDRLKRMEEYASRPSNGTGPTRHKIRVYSLSSQCNGVTKTFTMPRKTISVLSIFGTQFPVNFDTGDFTFSGGNITLGSSVGAPETGQTLYALYESLN